MVEPREPRAGTRLPRGAVVESAEAKARVDARCENGRREPRAARLGRDDEDDPDHDRCVEGDLVEDAAKPRLHARRGQGHARG